MEGFRDFEVVQNVYTKDDVRVDLVKPRILNSITPQQYVVKTVKVGKAFKEGRIHKELCELNPLILKYYCGWETKQNYYHCIEYCEQKSLNLLLIPAKRFSFEQVLDFCIQVAENLKILHDFQICHTDIKALNIFVTWDFKLKLGDFGSSKRIIGTDEEFHSIAGTRPYLSPELRKKFAVNKTKNNPYRDDIWALGKTFLEIFVGDVRTELSHASGIHSFIDKEFESGGSVGKFGELVKRMACIEITDFIEINLVLSELRLIDQLRASESLYGGIEGVVSGSNTRHVVGVSKENSFNFKAEIDLIAIREEKLDGSRLKNNEHLCIKGESCINKRNKRPISSTNLLEINKVKLEPREKEEEMKIISKEEKVSTEIRNKRKVLELCKIGSSEIKPSKKNKKIVADRGGLGDPTPNPENKPLNKCVKCSLSITCNKIPIDCGHFFHDNCFYGTFECKLRKANKKIDLFECSTCKKPIHFEKFYSNEKFSREARKNSYLQMLSHINFSCPQCNVSSEQYLLDTNLEDYVVVCKICTKRYCSFCDRTGSHYFSCDRLNEIDIEASKWIKY